MIISNKKFHIGQIYHILLNKYCVHKFFKILDLIENSVDPDQLASNEAS